MRTIAPPVVHQAARHRATGGNLRLPVTGWIILGVIVLPLVGKQVTLQTNFYGTATFTAALSDGVNTTATRTVCPTCTPSRLPASSVPSSARRSTRSASR